MATPFQVTVDCEDADRMVAVWSVTLGYGAEPTGEATNRDGAVRSPRDTCTHPLESSGAEPTGEATNRDGAVLRLRSSRRSNRSPRDTCTHPFESSGAEPPPAGYMHLDLRAGRTGGQTQAKIDELTAAGGNQRRRVDENGQWWMVMSDPEGNEFCVT